MSRLLGLNAALAEWQWHRGGRQKAASRRRQRARERAQLREPVPCDPCGCRAWCPTCDTRCLAGHANSPTRHWCPDGHFWDAPLARRLISVPETICGMVGHIHYAAPENCTLRWTGCHNPP